MRGLVVAVGDAELLVPEQRGKAIGVAQRPLGSHCSSSSPRGLLHRGARKSFLPRAGSHPAMIFHPRVTWSPTTAFRRPGSTPPDLRPLTMGVVTAVVTGPAEDGIG